MIMYNEHMHIEAVKISLVLCVCVSCCTNNKELFVHSTNSTHMCWYRFICQIQELHVVCVLIMQLEK